jgi:predicted nucleic acid-binding protein
VKLLVDTSILVDHLRADPRAVQVLGDAVERDDELWASVITRTELLRGMRHAERSRTTRLMDAFDWVEVSIEIADRAGQWARQYRRSHAGIDLADFLIAASAEALSARVVTQNVKHFPMFPGTEPAY